MKRKRSKGEMPMTTVQRCQKNSLYENTITDLIQLQSGSSSERSFNNGQLFKIIREGY